MRAMPRSIVVGNGNLLVNYDANYAVRDIFWPRVGEANHTMGNICRTGFRVDGKFVWVSDPAWEREIGYSGDSLVTLVTLRHAGLGIEVRFGDYVDMARDYFIRNLRVSSPAGFRSAQVFFHYDWYIDGSDIGNTVLYDPKHRAVIAYKGDRYFLLGGQAGTEFGISSWATGKKGGPAAGTWVDAEDGSLSRNPIEQGSVDCTIEFDLGAAAALEGKALTHWACVGSNFESVSNYGQELILQRGEANYRVRTTTYWTVWSDKDRRHIADELGPEVERLYRRSVLTVRTHSDNRGGIVAATDFDITKFARDTYAYVWPRDGALVANALDRAGHEDMTRKFFAFCRDVRSAGGYFLHKYTPHGYPGSSWHAWMDAGGERVLPIQEDETGLVLWALWEHFRIHHNLDFVAELYTSLVVPAADWMAGYFDDRNDLVKPSWDLWEERWGVHAFTVGAVWGGLQAAQNFGDLFGDAGFALRMKEARDRLRQAADRHLYRPELGRFARRLSVEPDGSLTADPILDSALGGLWRFGMYGPAEPQVVETMHAIRDELANRAASGGQARYADDHYFQAEPDLTTCPGNPWFICTLWLAQWYIASARSEADMVPARAIIDWTVRHQMPGGLLSEQLDPHTGAPLSVSPLTWSHAEFMVAVDDYVKRVLTLRRAGSRTRKLTRKELLEAGGA
jgi:GH15 family glucan-1,4-alpha-glucosidase